MLHMSEDEVEELHLSMDARSEERDETKLILELAALAHDKDLFFPDRTIFMGSTMDHGEESGVDAAMAGTFMKNLHVLQSLSHDPVSVVMNNIGGYVYHGLAIFDAIEATPCDLTILVRGHAMSMGSIILQAAKKRLMGRHSTQMIHYGTDGFYGHSRTFIKVADEAKRINQWMEELYLRRIREKRPRFTLRRLRTMLEHDTYLDASESIALGLADGIG